VPRRRLSSRQLEARLAAARADYEAAKARLEEIGFIAEGSLVERYMPCGKPTCRCVDPAYLHGPYYQLSWKEAGKTVSRRLSAEEARLYREWIDNRRSLESIVDEMKSISRNASRSLLAASGYQLQGPERPRRRRSSRRSRR
jgi:hypothetical protein